MAKCKNCKHLSTMQNYKKKYYKWCSLIDDCPHEDIERNCDFYTPMTNADRIRNMTDEELAELLRETAEESGCNLFDCEDFEGKPSCKNYRSNECGAYLEWLQSEVEE